MKYFLDTEFIEKPGSIQLISIGIVAEDGREYYAVSRDFNLKGAWKNEWLKENVLKSIHKELCLQIDRVTVSFTRRNLQRLIAICGKTNAAIAEDIIKMVRNRDGNYSPNLDTVIEKITRADVWNKAYYPQEFKYIKIHNTYIPETIHSSGMDGLGVERNKKIIYNQPEFYGYFADYDWVVFCWLFGKMIELPKGFPMFCMDLKQMMKERGLTKEWKQKNCPDPENEHNALADAKWNKMLYEKLIKFGPCFTMSDTNK